MYLMVSVTDFLGLLIRSWAAGVRVGMESARLSFLKDIPLRILVVLNAMRTNEHRPPGNIWLISPTSSSPNLATGQCDR